MIDRVISRQCLCLAVDVASGVHENDMCQGGWRVCHSVVCPRSEQAEFTLPAEPEVRKLLVRAVLCVGLY